MRLAGVLFLCLLVTAHAINLDSLRSRIGQKAPPPRGDFRARLRAGGVAEVDIQNLVEVAFVRQNRMEAAVGMAYQKETCTGMALRETLIRWIKLRLAIGDTGFTDQQKIGQLFQLPGAPGDGAALPPDPKKPNDPPANKINYDVHCGNDKRSGIFLGKVERITPLSTPQQKQDALQQSVDAVMDQLGRTSDKLNVRTLMHLSARAQEAGEKMEPTPTDPNFIGTTRWCIMKILQEKGDAAKKAAYDAIGFNWEHADKELAFQKELGNKAIDPTAGDPPADVKATNSDANVATLNGKAGKNLLTAQLAPGAVDLITTAQVHPSTAADMRKKGMFQALKYNQVNDRVQGKDWRGVASPFLDNNDPKKSKLLGKISALTDEVQTILGMPKLEQGETDFYTKRNAVPGYGDKAAAGNPAKKLPGYGFGGSVWPGMVVDQQNAAFMASLRRRLVGATAGPSGTTDEMMQMGDYVGVTKIPWFTFCLRGNAYAGMILGDHHSFDEVSEGAESVDRSFADTCKYTDQERASWPYLYYGDQCSWSPDDPFDRTTVVPPKNGADNLLSIAVDPKNGKITFSSTPNGYSQSDLRANTFDFYNKLTCCKNLADVLDQSDFPNLVCPDGGKSCQPSASIIPNVKIHRKEDEPALTPGASAAVPTKICGDSSPFPKGGAWRKEFCDLPDCAKVACSGPAQLAQKAS